MDIQEYEQLKDRLTDANSLMKQINEVKQMISLFEEIHTSVEYRDSYYDEDSGQREYMYNEEVYKFDFADAYLSRREYDYDNNELAKREIKIKIKDILKVTHGYSIDKAVYEMGLKDALLKMLKQRLDTLEERFKGL
jgi:hypothetical protein